MEFISLFSNMIIPVVFIVILYNGYSKKIDLYEAFKDGAVDGMKVVFEIMPTIIGLMLAVGVLRASGALQILTNMLSGLSDLIGFPNEALPLTFMRLVSSSASVGLLLDIFETYGPDSYLGRFVSIMMSSTETIMYTMSVYFMSIKVTKTRFTLAGALLANLSGVIFSLYITKVVYGY